MSPSLNFAILVDGENAQAKKYMDVLGEVSSKGNIAIKWIYADFGHQTNKGWEGVVRETASTPKQQFHISKDAADHALIMDAIELICTNERINAICIVSSDGGFAGLAQRVREKGLHVMAIGQKHTPEHFRNACHNFVYVENLNQDDEEPKDETEENGSALEPLLLKAYWQLVGDGDNVYLGDLGTKIKQLDSAFDSRTYGYASLKKLIKNCSEQLIIDSEQEDRCFVRLAYDEGKIKATPAKGNNFAFLIHNGQEFYFKKGDLLSSAQWKNIKKNQTVSFQRASKQQGKSPCATNVKLVALA